MSFAFDLMRPESGAALQCLISGVAPFRMSVVKALIRVEIHQLQTIIQRKQIFDGLLIFKGRKCTGRIKQHATGFKHCDNLI